jgi:hypothetical protein
MYSICWIVIRAKYSHEVKTNILRGVKQRNPLTLLLFNLCLEPQLEKTSENTEGINVREEGNIPILAFTIYLLFIYGIEKYFRNFRKKA